MQTYTVTVAPGLEPITTQELQALGLLPREETGPHAPLPPGTDLTFRGDRQALFRANLLLRTATRVLVNVGMPFMARKFPELIQRASHLPWERFLRPGHPLTLRVDSRGSKLYHEEAVAERIHAGIEARLGQPCPRLRGEEDAEGPPAQMVVVRIQDNRCTVFVDSSGSPLHRRGYRLATGKAPLREDLAAAILIASGWDGRSPLLDPFCGSGTIPIEAALIRHGIAPGALRQHFAFMDWPDFDPLEWKRTRQEADRTLSLSRTDPVEIFGSDRDAGAVRIAHENAARAGVADAIRFDCQAVSAIHPEGTGGWVVTNPPYGRRVSEGADLRDLYAGLGNVLRRRCPGWHVAILSGEQRLIAHTGLDLKVSLTFSHGGLQVNLAQGIVE